MPRSGGLTSNPHSNQAQISDVHLHHGNRGDCFEATWGGCSQWKTAAPHRSQSLSLRRGRQRQSVHGSSTYRPPEFGWGNKPLPPLPSSHQLQSLQSSIRRQSTGLVYPLVLQSTSQSASQKESASSRVSSLHSLVRGLKCMNLWGPASRPKMAAMPVERSHDMATQTYLTYAPDSPDPVIVDVNPRKNRHQSSRHGFESDSCSPSRPGPRKYPRSDQPSRRSVMSRWSRGGLENSTSNSDFNALEDWRQPGRAATPSPGASRLSNPPSQDSVGTYESRYSDRATACRTSTTPPRPSLQRKPASDSLLGHARQRSHGFTHSASPHPSSRGNSTGGESGEVVETLRSKAVVGAYYSRQSPSLAAKTYRIHEQDVSRDPIPLLLGPHPKIGRIARPSPEMRDEVVPEVQRVFRRPLGGYFEDAIVESGIPDHFQTSPLCPLNPKHKFGGGNWCPLHGGPQPLPHDQAKAGMSRFLGPCTAPVDRARTAQDDSIGFKDGWQEDLEAAGEFKLQPRGLHPRNSPSCPSNPRYGGRGVCVYHGRGVYDRLPED